MLFITRTALIFMISTEIHNEGNNSANHRINQSQALCGWLNLYQCWLCRAFTDTKEILINLGILKISYPDHNVSTTAISVIDYEKKRNAM